MKLKHFLKIELVLNVWNLLRNDGLTNSGCLHVVIAEVDEVHNQLEFPPSEKKWKRNELPPVKRMKEKEWMSTWDSKNLTPNGTERRWIRKGI
jgi:hypothetical protein